MPPCFNDYKGIFKIALRIHCQHPGQLPVNSLDVRQRKAQEDNVGLKLLDKDQAAEVLIPRNENPSLFVRSAQQLPIGKTCAADLLCCQHIMA